MEKRFALLLLIQLVVLKIFAQDTHMGASKFQGSASGNHSSVILSYDSLPKFYLGIGAGLNSYVGIIGAGTDIRIYKPLLLRAGIGVGTWGTKVSAGLRCELNHGRGWVFGVSYSECFGLKHFQDQLQTDSSSTLVTKMVTLDLNPTSTLNVTIAYNWIFHKNNKFYIEFGYAVPLKSTPYVVDSGDVLSSTSKEALDIISPGGFVLTFGLMFKII